MTCINIVWTCNDFANSESSIVNGRSYSYLLPFLFIKTIGAFNLIKYAFPICNVLNKQYPVYTTGPTTYTW